MPSELHDTFSLDSPNTANGNGASLEDLEALRARFDSIDEALLDLMQKRSQCSLAMGRYKQTHGDPIAHKPGREAQVLARLRTMAPAMNPDYIYHVYREIFSASRAMQGREHVAVVQSLPAVAAARNYFGGSAFFYGRPDNEQVLEQISRGACSLGLLALPGLGQCSVLQKKTPEDATMQHGGKKSPPALNTNDAPQNNARIFSAIAARQMLIRDMAPAVHQIILHEEDSSAPRSRSLCFPVISAQAADFFPHTVFLYLCLAAKEDALLAQQGQGLHPRADLKLWLPLQEVRSFPPALLPPAWIPSGDGFSTATEHAVLVLAGLCLPPDLITQDWSREQAGQTAADALPFLPVPPLWLGSFEAT